LWKNAPVNAPHAASLQGLAREARELARAGRAAEATRLWQRVLEADPGNPDALLALAQTALAARDPRSALALLERAAASGRPQPMIELCAALAHKELGDAPAEAAATSRALAIDPYFYPALLHQARMLERQGKPRQAARVFRDVLKVMPERDRTNPSLQRAVQHAQGAVEQNTASLEHYLDSALSGLRREHAGAPLERFERSLQVMVGRRRMYQPEPVMLHYADLPPIQFYDDALFPWMGELEAATDMIRAELLSVLAEGRSEFQPYVRHPAGAPLEQWAELNHSPRWSTYFLWEHGRPVEPHCARCPQTAALLARLPMAELPNFSPTAMFSCLEARTSIPPHTGETNTRLIVHLPLIVPHGCWFRVGNETREWRRGKAFVFDDTLEHEARNGSDELRVVLIFDIWNPFLSAAERDLVGGLVNAVRSYYQVEG
jgi:aspartyl/asparaginyl beta-hydroxylase (cupin superfamily)